MTHGGNRSHEALWIEPLAATVVFGLALFVNRSFEWPWIWVTDLVACIGAALSYRRPAAGALLIGLGLAVWLPFETTFASVSGIAFYINVFAAARRDLQWKAPLILGLAGLAYLSLVRKAVEIPADRWTTSIVLLIFLAIAYGGGLGYRWATQRIQRERETGDQRLQELQMSLARELHDSVAQTLSSAAMRANIVMTDPTLSPLAQDQLERISDECRSSAHDLRQLLSALREEPDRTVAPGPLADVESLRHSLEAQAQRLRSEGFETDMKVDLTKLSAARCQTLAAITVEATNNVLKHAKPGTLCTLSITQRSDGVVGEFTNVRKGAKGARRQGFGLTGIQERLTLLDGTSSVMSKAGQWTLQVWLPIGMETNGSPTSTPSTPEPLFVDGTSA